ncbi:MAG: LAO/AO transport system kinase [Xanthobacteraceae bacterium]|nr:MAG: LAO/AO transport system kinase [Xanthobacteraceae bacterium]
MAPKSLVWSPPVLMISGLANQGLDALWEQILAFRTKTEASGDFASKRRAQGVKWMWTMLHERVAERLKRDPQLKARLPALEADVAAGRLAPMVAVEEIAAVLGI